MQLTVLMDNNTIIDRYLLGEPGLSFHIATKQKNILFDAGYSDAFIHNASRMGIDLLKLDSIVLSHSHMDHSWGLAPLFRLFTEAMIEGLGTPKPEFTAHPDVFLSRTVDGLPEIGSFLTEASVANFCSMQLSKTPVRTTDRLVFLGEIPRSNNFENLAPMGKIRTSDGIADCYIQDDSAMAYRTDEGLVIITGCSHAGICNIIEHAREICGEERIKDVIGGFHLLNPPEEQMEGTLEYFSRLNAERVFACHCTDLKSKIKLSAVTNICEVGVGLKLDY
ncbi:MBL fold metallo-hydrolase [Desulfovibrio sp. JC010]|uniref:MBL fold metallo-hydrolase n=1 Tax=Desulfovibrio sp. JC010 TaxID=2593641 RepID=UPI0013D2776F|nr:MBL fold metallo-hydrolase [Desulfovibrio sp. JC010]NDV27424.1 MBL fold metallo-hydrolase [Desulfovibrio sp. JC010]